MKCWLNKLSATISLTTGLLIGSAMLLLHAPHVQAQTARKSPVVPAVRAHLLVSAEWLTKYLNDPKVIVLHVGRDRTIYDAGHVPGARFVPFADLVVTRDGIAAELAPVEKLQQVFSRAGVGTDAHIVLYGDVAGPTATRAYFTLDYLGFGEQTALLDGGLEKWKADKRPLSTDATEIKAAVFTPRLNPKVFVTREVVRDLSWQATNTTATTTALIDARPAEDYAGRASSLVPRPGHIPGAGNVYWMDTLASKENPTMRPVAELRKMYETAGAVPGKKIVTYCWIGLMASHAYFTAKYLGYDVAMYDGSFTEWSKTESLPVVGSNSKK